MIDKHQRAWFVIFIVAVFAAGIGVGSIVDRLLFPGPPWRDAAGRMSPMMGPPFGRGGRMAAGNLAIRLGDDLGLSGEQRSKLQTIFEGRRKRVEQIRADVQAKFEAEQRDFRSEIAAILTPDQRNRFDQWLERDPMGLRVPGAGGRPGMGRGRMGSGRGPGAGGRSPF